MCLTAAWAAVFVFMAVSCGGGKDVEAVVEKIRGIVAEKVGA